VARGDHAAGRGRGARRKATPEQPVPKHAAMTWMQKFIERILASMAPADPLRDVAPRWR